MTDRKDEMKPRLVAIDGHRTDEELPGDRLAGANTSPHPDDVGANDEAIRLKISQLEEEHRDLDIAIKSLEERMPYDRLTIQRLKKRKLVLKDEISELQEQVLPDIIA
ncbi:MAG: DUF465 domain-containing protein [Pseudomonadota bacterium]